jgi:hypothetical protein
MRKIPTLFKRDPENMKHVLSEVHPDCQWVLDGEGIATAKHDGTCFMLDEHGDWWARREVKPGKKTPPDFIPIETDENTGKTVGWEPAAASGFYKWLQEAAEHFVDDIPGTYELMGPKVQGNPERLSRHVLMSHGDEELRILPEELNYEQLPGILDDLQKFQGFEGVVWHHPDGRMA